MDEKGRLISTEYKYYRILPQITEKEALEYFIGEFSSKHSLNVIGDKFSVNDIKIRWFFKIDSTFIITRSLSSFSVKKSVPTGKKIGYPNKDGIVDKWFDITKDAYFDHKNETNYYSGVLVPKKTVAYYPEHCPIEKEDPCFDKVKAKECDMDPSLNSDVVAKADKSQQDSFLHYELAFNYLADRGYQYCGTICNLVLHNYDYKIIHKVTYFPCYYIETKNGIHFLDDTLNVSLKQASCKVYIPQITKDQALAILVEKVKKDECCSEKFRDDLINYDLNKCVLKLHPIIETKFTINRIEYEREEEDGKLHKKMESKEDRASMHHDAFDFAKFFPNIRDKAYDRLPTEEVHDNGEMRYERQQMLKEYHSSSYVIKAINEYMDEQLYLKYTKHSLLSYDATYDDDIRYYPAFEFYVEGKTLIVNAATQAIEKYDAPKGEKYNEYLEKVKKHAVHVQRRNIIALMIVLAVIIYVQVNFIILAYSFKMPGSDFMRIFSILGTISFIVSEVIVFLMYSKPLKRSIVNTFVSSTKNATDFMTAYKTSMHKTGLKELIILFAPLVALIVSVFICLAEDGMSFFERIFFIG